MSSKRHVESGPRREDNRAANCQPKPARLALVAAWALALAIPGGATGGAAAAAENAGAQGPAASSAPLSMSDQEVAALVQRLNLELTDKPVREMLKGWHKPKKAIIFAEGSPQWVPWLETAAPGVKFVVVNGSSEIPLRGSPTGPLKGTPASHLTKELLAQVADADILIGGGGCDVLKAAKKLQWIQSAHVGVEMLSDAGCFTDDMRKKYLDGDIILTNQKRTYGPAIAVHAVALMLALDRGLDLYVRMNDAEQFVKTSGRLRLPQGQTMLVVGLGGLGTEIARDAHNLGMNIIATRNSSHDKPDFVDYVGLPGELPDLIGKADVVVAAVPLTDQTRHMFNADTFGRMKKGALFINVARGGLVDSDALVAALKTGQVGGAGLDVTEPEPLPKGDPLWHAPNIIITPHMSAHFSGPDGSEQMANHSIETWAIMRENLRRYVAGDKLYSLVNPRLGY